MTDDLLKDLWLGHIPDVAVNALTIRANRVTVHATTTKDWIARVQQDQVPALRTFAVGLVQDLDAVVAGLSLRYSSGAVEGHNNKIKMLKRQMFGRASFELLRKRVLHSA